MGSFNRDRNQGNGRSFGGGSRGFGGDKRERPQMHPAICSNCGKSCEVPFKPTGAKPVLCSDCFRANGGPDRRPDDRPRFDKPRFEHRRDDRPAPVQAPQYKEQFDSMNHKLDKILGILLAAIEAELPKKTKKEIVDVIVEPKAEKKAKAPKKKVEEVVVAPVEPAIETPATETPTVEEPAA